METTATTRTASSLLQAAIAALREIDLPADGEAVRSAALDVAEIVRALDADDEVVIAAMIQPLLDGGFIERDGAVKRFGEEPLRLARALSQLGQFGLPADWTPERGLEAA
jgi:(p)ppGpp synthase/HD superfamily hydrolase